VRSAPHTTSLDCLMFLVLSSIGLLEICATVINYCRLISISINYFSFDIITAVRFIITHVVVLVRSCGDGVFDVHIAIGLRSLK